MDVFDLRNSLVQDYEAYISSFINISDARIWEYVDEQISRGLLWPDPLIQLNPSFKPGQDIDELISEGILHPECTKIFRTKKNQPEKKSFVSTSIRKMLYESQTQGKILY